MKQNHFDSEYDSKISAINRELASENENYYEGWCRPREETEVILTELAKKRKDIVSKYANQGVVEAQLELANYLYNDNDLPESFYWYIKAAEQNSEQAILALVNHNADKYLKCEEIDYTTEDLFKWTQKGAELFGENFKYYLAAMYFKGEGVEANLEEALRLSEIVAKSSDVNAYQARKLSLVIKRQLYKTTHDNYKSLPAYLSLIEQLVDEWDEEATLELAAMYEEGAYVKQDYDKAFMLYESLDENDSAHAEYKCGFFCENGLGVSKDIYKAASYYFKSAVNGCADGMKRLSEFYKTGTALVKDEYAAEYWSQKSLNTL